ncbi:hypothetical protein [Streptomyces sp. NPDC056660]|uniref:hypothetical protein n=1 Tax=Streptomyces sp. NPDC056660 TaxID=3345897 RepID=UPI00367B06B1
MGTIRAYERAYQLKHQLGLAPRLEAAHLDVEGVAGIAVVAAAHCDGYAATGHLLGLLAASPALTAAGERFWSDLWRSSGTAYLLPVNVKALVPRSLAGEGTAMARQIFSAVDEMTPPQRVAAGDVIGQALGECDDWPDLRAQVIRGVVAPGSGTAPWRVLHAERRRDDPAGRQAFVDAWAGAWLSASPRCTNSRAGHAPPEPDDAWSD